MRHTALACRLALIALAADSLSACGKSDTDPGPGGVTVGEARALDEAAAMIESRRPPEDTAAQPAEPAAPQPQPDRK